MLDALHEDSAAGAQGRRRSGAAQAASRRTPSSRRAPAIRGRDIDAALATERGCSSPTPILENGAGFQGRLVTFARTLVRGAAERDKPNDQRFREFTDASLPRIEQQLGASRAGVPGARRSCASATASQRMREWLGPDHPVVRKLLSKESPAELARRVVTDTQARRSGGAHGAVEGRQRGRRGVHRSDDRAVRAASTPRRAPCARPTKTASRRRCAPPPNASPARASRRWAPACIPDATFTLRLNYGTVQGWNENGTPVEPFTRLSRAFERATGADPFRIPESWQRVKDKLDMNTPFNLSTNNDIVGGNSGSPLINAKGEIVGLLFDGNIHSISGAYWFDTAKNRAIAVHPAIMREALSKVYGADALLAELDESRMGSGPVF